MKTNKGFTLVELMIVLVIIGIIAAFAIPNLLESQKAGNETSAEKALRTIVDAESNFMKADYDNDGKDFCFDLSMLHNTTDGAGTQIALIQSVLAAGTKEGYTYGTLADYDTASGTDPKFGFAYFAVPVSYGTSGRRSYIVNHTGTIYYSDQGSVIISAGDTWSGLNPAGSGSGWVLLGE